VLPLPSSAFNDIALMPYLSYGEGKPKKERFSYGGKRKILMARANWC